MIKGEKMKDPVRELLQKRKDKGIAIILGVKDSQCNEYLPEDVADALRKVILDQFNDYADLCGDLLNSYSSDSIILNEHYLKKLDDIHEALNG